MRSYNAYSGALRTRAQAWLRGRWEAGAYRRPSQCAACAQTVGAIQAHAEDYSEPFGAHIQAFHLCALCHAILHLRFRWPASWAWYRRCVRTGTQFAAASMGHAAASALLAHRGARPFLRVPPPRVLVLDSIHEGGAPSPDKPRVAPVRLIFAR